MSYRLEDLVNIPEFHKLLQSFYDVTGVPHGIIDISGNIISEMGWQDICKKFHREFPQTRQQCQQSDHFINKHLHEGNYVGYQCLNGLMDYGVPIIVEEQHVATIFFGQFLHEPPDEDYFRQQARKCGFDEASYLEALRQVPIISKQKVASVMELYTNLAQLLVSMGLNQLKQTEEINERKKMEEQLRYLSFHDALTGLYNRTYFEQEMNRLGGGRYSLGVIVGDVDGLKLTNDTLGHQTGDQLLVNAANILKQCLRTGDLVTRIGGDEFACLLPHCNQTIIKNILQRIRVAIDNYNEAHPELPLSISIGYATSERAEDINKLIKEADDNMYQEKLYRKQSARSSLIQILMKTLKARDFVTEGHSDRLQSLLTCMASAIGCPDSKLTVLRLLAQFHDIGKVGLPDHILIKPGPLTYTEVIEMQRHCEIGFHIAQAAPELVPIAEWILKHHEWWNGQGYPQGLKGHEIPLECRVLAIADAYDAMISDRPYRKAMTKEKALAELQTCAGTQFDPELIRIFVSLIEGNNPIFIRDE